MQESYTRDETETAVENYLNPDASSGKFQHDLIFKDDTEEVRITNSNDIKSREARLTVAMILDRTEGLTDRSTNNIAAEWAAHNVAHDISSLFGLSDWADRAKHVDINYDKDSRVVVDSATRLFQIIGWT